MISQGSKAHPVQLDPFQLIIRVAWSSAPIVYVELEGQMSFPSGIGAPSFKFLNTVNQGDSVTINGTQVKFGLAIGGISIGAGAAACADSLNTYLNGTPKPISGITSELSDTTVFIFYTGDKLALNSSGSAIETIGGIWFADPPIVGMVTKEAYDGIAMLIPFPIYVVGEDLIHLIVTEQLGPDFNWKLVYHSNYVTRVRIAALINFKVAKQAIIDIFAEAPNNYVYDPPGFHPPLAGAEPVRLLQTTINYVNVKAYPQGTEFKIEDEGKLSTTATPIWTISKTVTILDPRGKPVDSPSAVDAYNAYTLPTPWSRTRFDKSGEVI